jgi:hypothetical protein
MSVAVVHRYFHGGNKDHFYTTNAGEIGTTTPGQTGNNGYAYESSSFTVFTHHHHGLLPVYRYWNANTKDHFYTANPSEINANNVGQTGNNGYTNEGILGYVSPHAFPGSVAIYRYWHHGNTDHFYTSNAAEIGTTTPGAVGNHGYAFEGILGYAYPTDHQLVPVYRYWHEGNTDHFYTANAGEIGTTTPGAVGHHGFKFESVAFQIFNHHHPGLVPLYRYYHEGSKDHFYTANAGEIGTTTPGAVGNHGFKFEGVTGYISPTEFYGSVPLYRYYNGGTKDHFYTNDAHEIGTTHPGQVGKHGYAFEAIVGYVVH